MHAPLVAAPIEYWIDPAVAFTRWAAAHEHAFWLDGGPTADAGWSWVGIGDPDAEERAFATPLSGRGAWPAGPFRGGWIGWIGYERGASAVGAPVAVDEIAPPSVWLRVDRFLAFDHAHGQVWAVAPGDAAGRWAHELDLFAAAAPPSVAIVPPPRRIAHSRQSAAEYALLVEQCREAIRAGDAYQLCLTTRFTVEGSAIDPVATYLDLRRRTPAHHGGILRTGDVSLVSASPERFLDVWAGVARTRPVKGTRPRSSDPHEDAALATELRLSPKERAENVMIVDLMRNDLSRVSRPGSIRVEQLLEVESLAAVHQLVSTVSGRLADGVTVGDLVSATFPAGSMTGAPKLSAMSILHRLEAGPRGVFSGCFGWIGDDGAIDLAMVIRSIVVHPAGAYVGAGGGITWGSDAAAEVAEVGLKARAPLAALGAQPPAGW